MNKKLPLSMATILLVSLHVNAQEFKEVTISATAEKSVFTSQEYTNTQEFSNTLPSNMISTANSSGIKIDGATADFTKVYWNGIRVSDPSSTNAYPTFMNFGRNSAEVLSVDGSNINYHSKSSNYVEVEGGEKEYGRLNLSRTFGNENSTHTLKFESITQNAKSAYSDTQEFPSEEEKDRESNYNISYLSSINFAKNFNSNIAFLHKNVDYSYDGGYPTDANDSTSKFKTIANIGGVDVGYLNGKDEIKADFQYTSSDGEHYGANASEYDSQVLRYGLKVASDIGVQHTIVKASVYGVKESATIKSGGWTPIDDSYEREFVDYALALIYDFDGINFTISYDSSYKDTNSFLTSLKYPIYAGFSFIAKYEDSRINPTIIQEVNPYGAANDSLTSQKLNRVSGGFMYERKNVVLKADYSQIKTDDMIVWATIDPVTYEGQYQNLANVEYNFFRATLDYTFLEMFAINLDYSNIANVKSTDDGLVYNLPEHKAIAKLDYFSSMFNAYFLASYVSKQNSYSGPIDAATTYNMGIGYNVMNDLELRLDAYNLSDEYYEYVANYPQAGRIVTAGLKYQF